MAAQAANLDSGFRNEIAHREILPQETPTVAVTARQITCRRAVSSTSNLSAVTYPCDRNPDGKAASSWIGSPLMGW